MNTSHTASFAWLHSPLSNAEKVARAVGQLLGCVLASKQAMKHSRDIFKDAGWRFQSVFVLGESLPTHLHHHSICSVHDLHEGGNRHSGLRRQDMRHDSCRVQGTVRIKFQATFMDVLGRPITQVFNLKDIIRLCLDNPSGSAPSQSQFLPCGKMIPGNQDKITFDEIR